MKELDYKIALRELKGIGPISCKQMYPYLKTARRFFTAPKEDLFAIPHIGEKTATKLINSRKEALLRTKEQLRFMKQNSIQALCYQTNAYPNRLNYCDDGPMVLFQQGDFNLNVEKIICIVGTRKISEYGRKLIKDFLYDLKGIDVLVISGLAYGVDTEVHKACVEFNIKTVGVLAHGLDKLYPAVNKTLVTKMRNAGGGLLTEYFIHTFPDKQNFPERNRIVAGISDATIIVESDRKGGSLITADIANSYHRDVFAFPGRVGDQFSSGCNNLIQKRKAELLESAEQLFTAMGWGNSKLPKQNRQRQLFVELSEIDQKIVKTLMNEALPIHKISVKCKLPVSLVQTHLLTLELNGILKILPGNLYALN